MLRLSKVFIRGITIGLTLVALALAGGITSLQAAPVCTGETITVTNGQSLPFASLGPGVCVVVGDVVVGNFDLSNLPAVGAASVQFTFGSSAGLSEQTLAFNAAFAPQASFMSSYDVAVNVAGETISGLGADFIQSRGGPSNLVIETNPMGDGPINLEKFNAIGMGQSTISFTGDVMDLAVSSTLTTGPDSNVTSISNAIAEPLLPPVTTPEPAALELLGVALAGFGAFGLRRKA